MRLGILGAGQLALMLADASARLGVTPVFLSPDPDACAAPRGVFVPGRYDDPDTLARFAKRVDVVTFEFENVPVEAVAWLEERRPVRPSSRALAVAQDRLLEKRCFTRLGIPVPRFEAVDSHADLIRSAETVGLPAVLKTRTLGYDGKGQVVLRHARPDALEDAWRAIGGAPAILEELVPFDRELSVIGVQSLSGEQMFYPLNENVHRDGILRLTMARADHPLRGTAEEYARRLLQEFGYAGVLTLELFEVDGRLLANEMAPRVHNSGHWTIEGAETSQFENHVRAVCGLPLGHTGQKHAAAMVNLVGTLPDTGSVRQIPHAHLHAYGKEERPGRKVGHVTLIDDAGEATGFLGRVTRALQLAGEGDLADRARTFDALGRRTPLAAVHDEDVDT